MRRLPEWLFVFVAAMVAFVSPGRAADLYIGVAEVDITHAQPMALWGQMHTRISTSVESPVTAHVVALESREGDRTVDSAIMVSCDIIGLPHSVLVTLRERVAERLPEFDVQKLFVSGTHTHTGPVFREGAYRIPEEGVVQPTEYVRFFIDRVSEAVASAWQDRQPGAVAWGLGHAVVGHNRRAVYADGRAVMYGRTAQSDFRGIEGYEDHAVEVIFFVDRHATQKDKPTHGIEIHVLRLGDVAIATNPFELFLDFGIQIKARSPALQTFVVQLVGIEGYVPTQRAVRGGGYSAIAESNTVGPEGGQVLVDRTVELIESLWPEP